MVFDCFLFDIAVMSRCKKTNYNEVNRDEIGAKRHQSIDNDLSDKSSNL